MTEAEKFCEGEIKDVPEIWKLAKKHKKYKAFLCSVSLLFFPLIIRTMWLYDTDLKIDKPVYAIHFTLEDNDGNN